LLILKDTLRFDPGGKRVRMVKPAFRRKSIGTKVSDEEYARLEALAGEPSG
jgi:hypothetical protein